MSENKDDKPIFKWDVEAKQKRDDQRAMESAAEKLAGRRRVVAIKINNTFKKWMKELCRQKRSKEEVEAFLEQLPKMYAAIPDIDEVMPEWKRFTDEFIKMKLAEIMADNMVSENVIEQLSPTGDRVENGATTITTREEFESIPFIDAIRKCKAFVGFLRNPPKLIALFDDGDTTDIAIYQNNRGIDHIPPAMVFDDEAKKKVRDN